MIFVITGFITSIQFKQDLNRTDIITMRTLFEDQKNIDNEKLEIERLRKHITELEDKLQSYNSEEYDVEDILVSLKNELELHRVYAGQEDLIGPGIRIYMQDSEEYAEGQNINNFIIHNSDVLQIINDLRGAEAERIAINGTQIFWDTEIDCNGATIRVGDEIYAPPFIIEAIGDPKRLEGALKAPNSIVQLMRLWSIRIDIEKHENIIIKGIDRMPQYKFLKNIEEGV